MEEKLDPSSEQNPETSNVIKRTITIIVDEEDCCPCVKDKEKDDEEKIEEEDKYELRTPGVDPRFQQQNQAQRCFVMYTDFYRCEHILGEGSEACTWFKKVFTSICPNDWVEHWDDLRVTGRLSWHKYRTQGPFPGSTYGD